MASSKSRCIISVPSVNYAMSAVHLLLNHNISARQVKTDPSEGKPGCSNAVEVDCEQLRWARSILIRNNIPIS